MMEPSRQQSSSDDPPQPLAAPAPPASRPQLLSAADAPRPDPLFEEVRLARLATEVLRQLVAAQVPPTPVLARYLGVGEDDVACCAAGVQRLPAASRRMLARVALAFAPIGLRHTARRLYEGEIARPA